MQIDYNLPTSLQSNIEEFKTKLPSLKNIKISGEFTYGCCGKSIEKSADLIYYHMECPHCLDYYETDKEFYNEYGYKNKIKITPTFSDNFKKIPKLNENGEHIFYAEKPSNIKGTSHPTKLEAETEWGYLAYHGKKHRVMFNNQKEFDIIANILDMLNELPNGFYMNNSIEYSEFRVNTSFGPSELDFINSNNLTPEFSYIMTVKQILVNKLLIDATNELYKKIGNAGMALL